MADERTKYADFEELVFENRNKEYGAYDLRKSYKGLLTKAFFIGTTFFLAAIVLPFIYMKATEGEKVKEVNVDLSIKDVDTPDLPEEEEVEEEEIFEQPKEEQLQSLEDLAPPPTSEPIATIQNVVPEPKQDAKHETPPPTKEEMQDKAIGTKTQEGVAVTTNQPTQPKGVEGGRGNQEKIEGTKVVDKPVDTKIIHTEVDVEAEFSAGGIDGFRRRVQENFDTEAVEGEGILTTTVSFVVEVDGSISQVKATGSNSDFNREAERTIKSIRTKWKPGKKGNQSVRSRFRFPLKMKFE